ncbi:MAG: hypothetical protein QF410_15705 [Planctomycetota bacterium]|nr:hypothetical protein [Planctomycetota bacterium]
MNDAARPLGLAYWALPERLLAGAYPGHGDPEIETRQLGALLGAGVVRVLDLMDEEPRGAPPYAPRLVELARERGVQVRIERVPIEDHGVPGPAELALLEAWLDRIPSNPHAPRGASYLHCWGGRGRTGLAVGVALLRRHRADAETLLPRLARLRTGLPGESPESDEQRSFLRDYAAALRARS